jgi:hypothetical protein
MSSTALRKRLGKIEATTPALEMSDRDLLVRIAELIALVGNDMPEEIRVMVDEIDAEEAARRAYDMRPDVVATIETPLRSDFRWPRLLRVHDTPFLPIGGKQ